jgi:hypothetical protein
MEPQSPPPPASPFNPVPRPIPPSGGGCSKPLVVGCVAIFLVGAIAVIGGILYVGSHADSLLQWILQTTETNLLAQLPKDVTPLERANLQQAFADVRHGLQQRAIPRERLQPVQFKIMEITRKGSSVTRQDILDFTRTLQDVAGKPVGPSTPTPAPTPTPSPTPSPGPIGTPAPATTT